MVQLRPERPQDIFFRQNLIPTAEPRPGETSLIIEADGHRAGWLLLKPDPTTIVEIIVAPELRGQGIGTAALRLLLADHNPIRLYVHTANLGARRLYERLGFRYLESNRVQLLMEHR